MPLSIPGEEAVVIELGFMEGIMLRNMAHVVNILPNRLRNILHNDVIGMHVVVASMDLEPASSLSPVTMKTERAYKLVDGIEDGEELTA